MRDPNPFYPVVCALRSQYCIRSRICLRCLSVCQFDRHRLAGARGIKASVMQVLLRNRPASRGIVSISTWYTCSDQISFVEEKIPLAATFEGSFRSAFGGTEGRRASRQPDGGVGGSAKSVKRKLPLSWRSFVLDGYLQGYHNTTFALNMSIGC